MRNPVFLWLTRRQGDFSIGAILSAAIGATIVGILLILVEGGGFQAATSGPFDWLFILFLWFIVFASPLALTIIAAEYTARHAAMDLMGQIRITTIPNHKLVQGFFLAALVDIRRWLIIMAGMFMPVIAAIQLRFHLLLDCSQGDSIWGCARAPLLPLSDQIGWAIFSLEITIGFWGLNILATAIGVATGLWWRNEILAIGSAMLVVLGIVTVTFRFLVLNSDLSTIYAALPIATLGMVLPYLLALACLRLSATWAWRGDIKKGR